MTSAIDVVGASEEERASSRMAFHRYCSLVLSAILDHALLLDSEASTIRPDSYRLRCRDTESARIYGIGEQVDLGWATDGIPRGLVLASTDALLELTVPENAATALFRAEWRSRCTPDGGSWNTPPDLSGDFTFSFPVPVVEPAESELDFAARLLAVLLDEIDLLIGESAVFPAFVRSGAAQAEVPLLAVGRSHPLANREELTKQQIRRQPLFSVSQTEPTIPILARHWALLSASADIERAGDATVVEGFRLRRTSDWVVPSHGHPSEVYEHLARICNVACSFCYLFGNPDTLAIARARKSIARDELDTRIHYYDPTNHQALFSAQWELNEFLVDPRLPEVMKTIRARTDRPFFFTTNGNPLTPEVVAQLAELKPVHFVVSTNTVDEPLRQEVMKEKAGRTWTALHCLEELRKHEIPFGVSMVATPDFPLEDLAATVHAVEALDPTFIRVNEPGFTRDHPESMGLDTDELWPRVITWVQQMRQQTKVPIIAIPSAYEENFFHDDPLAPRIIGTVAGSPAASIGLRPGDVIEKVGFLRPQTRSELVSALLCVRGKVKLGVRRMTAQHEILLDTEVATSYPYPGRIIGKYLIPHGIVTAPSLSAADAQSIRQAIDEVGATTAWLVTSSLMLPAAQAFFERFLPDLFDRVDLVVASNDYLGGNIRVMDMCTIGDIDAALQRHADRTGQRPDVVLLPSTGFNAHGRDLIGRQWGDLERAWRVPTRLLGATTQFVF